jgi:hypothetical protein
MIENPKPGMRIWYDGNRRGPATLVNITSSHWTIRMDKGSMLSVPAGPANLKSVPLEKAPKEIKPRDLSPRIIIK